MDLGLIRKDTLYVTGSNIGRGQDDMVHNNCNSHGANCINNNLMGERNCIYRDWIIVTKAKSP